MHCPASILRLLRPIVSSAYPKIAEAQTICWQLTERRICKSNDEQLIYGVLATAAAQTTTEISPTAAEIAQRGPVGLERDRIGFSGSPQTPHDSKISACVAIRSAPPSHAMTSLSRIAEVRRLNPPLLSVALRGRRRIGPLELTFRQY